MWCPCCPLFKSMCGLPPLCVCDVCCIFNESLCVFEMASSSSAPPVKCKIFVVCGKCSVRFEVVRTDRTVSKWKGSWREVRTDGKQDESTWLTSNHWWSHKIHVSPAGDASEDEKIFSLKSKRHLLVKSHDRNTWFTYLMTSTLDITAKLTLVIYLNQLSDPILTNIKD